MTPEAQNIAIAESLGCKDCHAVGGLPCGVYPNEREHRALKKYTASLDACAEFEANLSRLQRIVYGHLLCELVLTEPPDFDTSDITRWNYAGITSVSDVLSATAPQRCEAYLRTMNLWQESK